MKQAPKIKIPFYTYYPLVLKDPIGLRTKIFAEYGEMAWRKTKGIITYQIYHPDHVKHILQDNQNNYLNRHPIIQSFFKDIMGSNNIFTNNDLEQWHFDRMTADPAFEPKVYFQDYAKTITQLSNQMLDRWHLNYKDGENIDIDREIGVLILSIFSQTLINEKIDVEFFYNLIINYNVLFKSKLRTPFFLWPFSPHKKKYDQECVFIKKIIRDLVKDKMSSDFHWDDLLGRFLREYKHLSKDEVIELIGTQITIFFAVSYLTTSSLIEWILIELSQRPEVERQIAYELNEVVGNRIPTYEDVASLKYLSCVIKEVLRLHPSVYSNYRQAISPDTMDGFEIPAKAGIIISIPHVHRHPDFWVNPEGFDPERFRNNPLGQTHPFAYIPFSSGKRRCPGSGFSTLETTLIVAMIVQRARLFLPPYVEVKPFITSLTTMRPSVHEMKIKYKI